MGAGGVPGAAISMTAGVHWDEPSVGVTNAVVKRGGDAHADQGQQRGRSTRPGRLRDLARRVQMIGVHVELTTEAQVLD